MPYASPITLRHIVLRYDDVISGLSVDFEHQSIIIKTLLLPHEAFLQWYQDIVGHKLKWSRAWINLKPTFLVV